MSLNQERALTGRLCAIMRCNWSDLQRPQRAQIDCGPIHVNRLISSNKIANETVPGGVRRVTARTLPRLHYATRRVNVIDTHTMRHTRNTVDIAER